MAADFSIKRNDNRPILGLTLYDGGAAFDVSGYTVVAIMRLQTGGVPKVNRKPCTIVNATAGQIEIPWTTDDTDTEGAYYLEIEAVGGSGQIITFPTIGYFTVDVIEDLG